MSIQVASDAHHKQWHAGCFAFPAVAFQGGKAMDMSIDFKAFFPHHDLLIEMGRVEMAMEHLDQRADDERRSLRPRLESRMHRLRSELDHLVV